MAKADTAAPSERHENFARMADTRAQSGPPPTPIDTSVFARFSLSAHVAPMELGRGPFGEL
jgi:hypothetical protein